MMTAGQSASSLAAPGGQGAPCVQVQRVGCRECKQVWLSCFVLPLPPFFLRAVSGGVWSLRLDPPLPRPRSGFAALTRYVHGRASADVQYHNCAPGTSPLW
eukprot:scaffold2404_cov398-Prasinococcus_capsulatus_cf.AAC.6